MKSLLVPGFAVAALMAGCATTGEGPGKMSPEELANCLQPNRRAMMEIVGQEPKPAPKTKPGEPAPKPGKPEFSNVELKVSAQGNGAFDIGGAALKPEGAKEIDAFIASIGKRSVRIGAIVVTGHTDRLEQARNPGLSEARARALADHAAARGLDRKLIFWEGKGDKDPVPVTKFCD